MSDDDKKQRAKRIRKRRKEARQAGFKDRMRHTMEEREYTPEMTGHRPSYSNRSYVENLLDMVQDQGEYL